MRAAVPPFTASAYLRPCRAAKLRSNSPCVPSAPTGQSVSPVITRVISASASLSTSRQAGSSAVTAGAPPRRAGVANMGAVYGETGDARRETILADGGPVLILMVLVVGRWVS